MQSKSGNNTNSSGKAIRSNNLSGRSLFVRLSGFAVLPLAFICFASSLLAQQSGIPSTPSVVKQNREPLLITFARSPERSIPSADTLPDSEFRLYDPARRKIIDWGTLGNLGSAARPLLFENRPLRGFSVGVHAFDLYQLQPEQLGFYRNVGTFSDASFSQGRNQFETNLNARFARTFTGGASFSVEYRTLNNLGQYR